MNEPVLRHGFADLPGARLHYVEAGEGPLVVLLHGFPQCWFAWEAQIPALAAAGFHVVAPDLRGYGASSKPYDVRAYDLDLVAGDVRDLIAERGAQRAMVAGHDWGGAVAWTLAMADPEVVERLAILNMPHPRRMMEALRGPRQLLRSWYVFLFQLPRLPERLLEAREHRALVQVLEHGSPAGPLSIRELMAYRLAWSQPGAVRGMLAYYRAAVRSPRAAEERLRVVRAPTLVIWGDNDPALGRELAEPDVADVPNLVGVEHLPAATHWVMREEPERVSALLAGFFAAV